MIINFVKKKMLLYRFLVCCIFLFINNSINAQSLIDLGSSLGCVDEASSFL